MSCHVWINLVLSDIIDYAERNRLDEVSETLRETASRVAPLLDRTDAAVPEGGTFDLFPLDLRRALAGQAPELGAGCPQRRLV